jgi:hypothetical protein
VTLRLPFYLASITDPIVNAGTDFISATGLPAVFVLMGLESACLPVPSEAIMLFAGASVDQAVMILKMLRPKTDIRRPQDRTKTRITALTLPRIEPPSPPA